VLLWHVIYNGPRRRERKRRYAALKDARGAYQKVVDQAHELGPDGFSVAHQHLQQLHHEYIVEIPAQARQVLADFDKHASEQQRQRYLSSCFIDRASIPGLGSARKRTLQAYGIETAASIEPNRIMSIRGFGSGLTTELVSWRDDCIRQFRFNPNDPITASERVQSIGFLQQRRRSLEAELVAGLGDLRKRSNIPDATRRQFERKLEEAKLNLEQAECDLLKVSW
jgi:DNA-binding helix-hairpin-helix protein with protein kinase domain